MPNNTQIMLVKSEKLNLLLIEDNPGDVRIIRELLRDLGELEFCHVSRLSSALDHLRNKRTDIVLLDMGLPDSQGMDTIRRVVAEIPLIPVIVLTGMKDDGLALESIKAGAQDYLVKGFIDAELLRRSIQYAVERKRMEVELYKSRANIAALIENSIDRIWSVDVNSCLLIGNIGFYQYSDQFFGRKIEPGENTLDLTLDPSIREEWRNYFKRTLRGERFNIVREMPVGGDIRILDLSFNPILIKDGTIAGIVISGRDITDRMKSEENLIKLNKAIDSSGEVIFMTDPEGIITFINPAFTSLYGFSPDEVIGKVTPRILRNDSKEPSFYQQLWTQLKAGKEIKGEFVNKTKDGRLVNIEASSSPVFSEDHKIIGFLGIQRDITQRKEAEEFLMASEKKYRDLFNNDLAGHFITTVSGEILLCNRAYVNIFGFGSMEDALRFNVKGLYKNEEARNRIMNALGEKRKLELLEQELVRPDGKPITVLVNNIGDFNENDELVRIFGHLIDITEQKQVREEIRKLNEDLEQRVLDRTIEFQRINKELEAFSYTVSHDLRAPLRALDGYASILLDEYGQNLDDEGKDICSRIKENSRRMGQLIDNLLSFSRLSRSVMNLSDVNMKEMAGSVFKELLSPDLKSRIDFRLDELEPVAGDRTLLQQVWINLISNAIKFSSSRERIVISISCKKTNTSIEYSIADNGAGFDMKYSDKLFGVFQRLHSEKEFSGTGVGLAIVHRIITRHGGEVWAESEVDKGAKFHFSIPREPQISYEIPKVSSS